MILVYDMDDEEAQSKRDKLYDLDYEYNVANDILIMPIVVNIDHFNRWMGAYPFYNNVAREGIELYDAEDAAVG